MEAFLLTMDVFGLILLCLGVLRVSRSQDGQDLGWFTYSVHRIKKEKRTFVDSEAPHA